LLQVGLLCGQMMLVRVCMRIYAAIHSKRPTTGGKPMPGLRRNAVLVN
jgi:hypothetical protein